MVKIKNKRIIVITLLILLVFCLIQFNVFPKLEIMFASSNSSVTDTFDDESKIASRSNLVVSDGQVRLGECRSLGCVCSSGSDCDSSYCYRDADSDGYAALSGEKICKASQFLGTDCYDANANAKPGQANYFTAHRGDGSFDYNCNGVADKYYGKTATSCYLDGGSPACSFPDVGNCYRGSYSYSTTCGAYVYGCYTYGLNSSCVSISQACYMDFCGYGYGVQGGGICTYGIESCR